MKDGNSNANSTPTRNGNSNALHAHQNNSYEMDEHVWYLRSLLTNRRNESSSLFFRYVYECLSLDVCIQFILHNKFHFTQRLPLHPRQSTSYPLSYHQVMPAAAPFTIPSYQQRRARFPPSLFVGHKNLESYGWTAGPLKDKWAKSGGGKKLLPPEGRVSAFRAQVTFAGPMSPTTFCGSPT